MRKLILLSSLIITLFGAVLYTATGTPSTLIVKTDATNALLVTAATQVNPVTSGVFASRRLSTDASGNLIVVLAGGGVAPVDATYITQTPDATLTNEQALSTLASGIMRVATTTGVVTSLTTSAGIASNISDETGTGVLVFNDSPSFTTLLTTVRAVITQGTITDPALNINSTVTWNDAADTFTAWKLNVTNTASNAASRLLDLQVASSSIFFFKPDGTFSTPFWMFDGSTGSILITSTGSSNSYDLASDTKFLRNIYSNSYYRGAILLISGTAPSSPVACTSPAVSWSNGTATFQIDVGTSCTGVTTLSFTMPASINGWECTASNTTTAARDVWATAWTTTSVTLTNTARTTGLATDWADGADIRVKCMAG